MTKCTHRPTITLPLLIAYVDSLLPSLAQDNQTNINHNNDDVQLGNNTQLGNNIQLDDITQLDGNAFNRCLWALQDKASVSTLHSQLDKQVKHTKTLITDYDIKTLATLNQETVKQRYELSCFWLPTLTEEQLQQFIPLIMRYRDLYAAHLLIAVDSSLDLLAYGFTPFDILNEVSPKLIDNKVDDSLITEASITLWQFNLYDYKQLPNWLNADYWANPENWNKTRW